MAQTASTQSEELGNAAALIGFLSVLFFGFVVGPVAIALGIWAVARQRGAFMGAFGIAFGLAGTIIWTGWQVILYVSA